MNRADFDVTACRGPYRVEKADGWSKRRRRTHMTFVAAEAAAASLLAENPGETFVIIQEVARVARHLTTTREGQAR